MIPRLAKVIDTMDILCGMNPKYEAVIESDEEGDEVEKYPCVPE